MTTSLRELAALVGGLVEGDGDAPISGANPISQVASGEITMIDAAARCEAVAASPAAAVLLAVSLDGPISIPKIRVDDPHGAFRKIVARFRPNRPPPQAGIHPSAFVAPTARVAESASIGAGCTIGDHAVIGPRAVLHAGVHVGTGADIGEDVTLHPAVVLYEDVVIGKRVTIHAGSVIGAHGFVTVFENGRHVPAAAVGKRRRSG